MWFSGYFDLPWYGYVLVALGLTHITIAAVTIFLHRHQAHRSLDLHPIVSHFFRFWLWMTTGMVTKEWAAIHRKHHAKCETPEDPHSPQQLGINKVLWTGVLLYVKEAHNKETIERYGHGTPDDWMERNVYSKHPVWGLTAMALIDVFSFGIVTGAIIFVTQIAWIPFWAAGVINGIGHFWGYRNFQAEDASRNIIPWGILIGGEELHNNHHAYATSARLSNKWYEFDIGWAYIQTMAFFGLAKVKHVAPKIVRLSAPKPVCDGTVQAILLHRYDVLARYSRGLKSAWSAEKVRLSHLPEVMHVDWKKLKSWLQRDVSELPEKERATFTQLLANSKVLQTWYSMRKDLTELWKRSTATKEQLVKQLDEWCHRAENSGIEALQNLSLRMRTYAV